MKTLTALILLALSSWALAVPATFDSNIAPTFTQPASGVPDGYRLYSGCDLIAGTVGTLEDGLYTSGKAYSVAGDTATPPVLCVVAFNAVGEGAFDAVISLSAALQAPGAVVNIQVGDCTVTVSTGEQYACTVILN